MSMVQDRVSAAALDKCLTCIYLAQLAEQFYKNYALGYGLPARRAQVFLDSWSLVSCPPALPQTSQV